MDFNNEEDYVIEEVEKNNNEDQEQQEELDDDLYLLELHKRLEMMKKERKKAEQDTKLLDNRLRLLKGEEERNWKKIAQTKKKTNEKVLNLQKMAELMKQKELLRENQEREIENKRIYTQQMRHEIKNNILIKREEKLRQLNEGAKILKMQKQYNIDLKAYLKSEELNNNRNKYETAKGQQLVFEEKKKALEMEKKLKMKLELERKLLEEYRLKEEAEAKLSQIEQEEIDVLKRIRTTTQVHQNLCENLENINLQDIQIDNKYNTTDKGFVKSQK